MEVKVTVWICSLLRGCVEIIFCDLKLFTGFLLLSNEKKQFHLSVL